MPVTPSASAFRSWQESQEVLQQYLEAGARFAITPAAQQIHLGTIVRDATTAYEVYLTGALNELFGFYGHTFQASGLSAWPSWSELKRQYLKCMECDIEPEPIKRIRALRHLLTHRYGQVETEEERALFSNLLDSQTSQSNARILLSTAYTLDILDCVDRQVGSVQSMVHHFSIGRGRSRVLSLS